MWLIVVAAMVSESNVPEPAADTAAQSALERFQRIDRDRNGYITANEAPRIASTRGSAADPAPTGPSWIESYDQNKDSQVSSAEYLSRSLAGRATAVPGSALSQR